MHSRNWKSAADLFLVIAYPALSEAALLAEGGAVGTVDDGCECDDDTKLSRSVDWSNCCVFWPTGGDVNVVSAVIFQTRMLANQDVTGTLLPQLILSCLFCLPKCYPGNPVPCSGQEYETSQLTVSHFLPTLFVPSQTASPSTRKPRGFPKTGISTPFRSTPNVQEKMSFCSIIYDIK